MAVDYFLKLDTVDGESTDKDHKNQIQLLSFSWGASNTSSVAGTGGSGAGKVDLSDFSVMTFFDKATPKLFKNITKGTHFKTGNVEAVKSGSDGKPYLKLDFKEMFCTSLQMSASNEIPTVSISFSYNEVKMEYFAQNEQGNLVSTGAVTYNVKENKVS
jgi:type VI secretion system secreted protein Hcp